MNPHRDPFDEIDVLRVQVTALHGLIARQETHIAALTASLIQLAELVGEDEPLDALAIELRVRAEHPPNGIGPELPPIYVVGPADELDDQEPA